jgi:hypothetical protein
LFDVDFVESEQAFNVIKTNKNKLRYFIAEAQKKKLTGMTG